MHAEAQMPIRKLVSRHIFLSEAGEVFFLRWLRCPFECSAIKLATSASTRIDCHPSAVNLINGFVGQREELFPHLAQ